MWSMWPGCASSYREAVQEPTRRPAQAPIIYGPGRGRYSLEPLHNTQTIRAVSLSSRLAGAVLSSCRTPTAVAVGLSTTGCRSQHHPAAWLRGDARAQVVDWHTHRATSSSVSFEQPNCVRKRRGGWAQERRRPERASCCQPWPRPAQYRPPPALEAYCNQCGHQRHQTRSRGQ